MEQKKITKICEHCKMDISIRNPSGFCDHLYYPDYCKVCKSKKIEKEREKEMDKVWKDVKKNNFGIFDPNTNKRINPANLAFFWRHADEKKSIREEIVLHRNLMLIQEIYKKKFETQSPYEMKLFNKDIGKFLERLVRATEICTMEHVLNKGGALNTDKTLTITKGRQNFMWETIE